MKEYIRDRLVLSVAYGLLGEVQANLRTVLADVDENAEVINIRFFFDNAVTAQNTDCAESVAAEVRDFFHSPWQINFTVHLINAPTDVPRIGMTLFSRREDYWPSTIAPGT